MLKAILGQLMVLVVISCFQQKSNSALPQEQVSNPQNVVKSRLNIENSPTRGTGFTDTLGEKYGLVYITSTITNDSTIPVHFQITFSKVYDYPESLGNEQFNLILLPNAWTQAGFEITDGRMNDLLKHPGATTFNTSIEPGEKLALTIGLFRPMRPAICSATPYAILDLRDTQNLPTCELKMNENQESSDVLVLGLKVGFCTVGEVYERCTIIPCGRVSYRNHSIE